MRGEREGKKKKVARGIERERKRKEEGNAILQRLI